MKIFNVLPTLHSYCLTVVFFLVCHVSHAQVTMANSWQITDRSHTTVAGSNRLLVYCLTLEDDPGSPFSTVTGVTFGGQPMTLAVELSPGHRRNIQIWYLNDAGISAAGPPGTYTISPTFINGMPRNDGDDGWHGHSVTLEGVDQSSPIFASGAQTNNSNTVSLPSAISVEAKDMVIYAAEGYNGSHLHTPPSGYSEQTDNGKQHNSLSVGTKAIATTGSENPSVGTTNGGSSFLAAVTIAATTVLPVEWSSLDVWNVGNLVAGIRWSVESQKQNEKFLVQKSYDGAKWEIIGEVKGDGTTKEFSIYEYLDINGRLGVNYYRIGQQDIDGKISYTQIKQVYFENAQPNHELKVFPNPARNVVNFSGYFETAGSINVNIADASGKLVMEHVEDVREGSYLRSLNIDHLEEGMYFIWVVEPNGEISDFKIAVIR